MDENGQEAVVVSEAARPAPDNIIPASPSKDPAIAVLLNFFFYVVGYFYLGQWQKAIVWLLLPLFFAASAVLTCGVSLVALPLMILLPLFNLFDAYYQAKNLRDGHPIGQWTFFGEHA